MKLKRMIYFVSLIIFISFFVSCKIYDENFHNAKEHYYFGIILNNLDENSENFISFKENYSKIEIEYNYVDKLDDYYERLDWLHPKQIEIIDYDYLVLEKSPINKTFFISYSNPNTSFYSSSKWNLVKNLIIENYDLMNFYMVSTDFNLKEGIDIDLNQNYSLELNKMPLSMPKLYFKNYSLYYDKCLLFFSNSQFCYYDDNLAFFKLNNDTKFNLTWFYINNQNKNLYLNYTETDEINIEIKTNVGLFSLINITHILNESILNNNLTYIEFINYTPYFNTTNYDFSFKVISKENISNLSIEFKSNLSVDNFSNNNINISKINDIYLINFSGINLSNLAYDIKVIIQTNNSYSQFTISNFIKKIKLLNMDIDIFYPLGKNAFNLGNNILFDIVLDNDDYIDSQKFKFAFFLNNQSIDEENLIIPNNYSEDHINLSIYFKGSGLFQSEYISKIINVSFENESENVSIPPPPSNPPSVPPVTTPPVTAPPVTTPPVTAPPVISSNSQTNLSSSSNSSNDELENVFHKILYDDVFSENYSININEIKYDSKNYTEINKIKVKDKKDISILEFEHNFSKYDLNLNSLKIILSDENENNSYIIIKGLNLSSDFKKSVRFEKKYSTGLLCIKDSNVNSILEFSKDCNLKDEFIINCDAKLAYDKYTCIDEGNYYFISGLEHSAIIEFRDYFNKSFETNISSGENKSNILLNNEDLDQKLIKKKDYSLVFILILIVIIVIIIIFITFNYEKNKRFSKKTSKFENANNENSNNLVNYVRNNKNLYPWNQIKGNLLRNGANLELLDKICQDEYYDFTKNYVNKYKSSYPWEVIENKLKNDGLSQNLIDRVRKEEYL